jgi:hypothetical protein
MPDMLAILSHCIEASKFCHVLNCSFVCVCVCPCVCVCVCVCVM